MAILKPLEKRVKMRLLLGTHHFLGVEVFRNVQKDVETKAVSTRQTFQSNAVDNRFYFRATSWPKSKHNVMGLDALLTVIGVPACYSA